jgi:hypothetical protein
MFREIGEWDAHMLIMKLKISAVPYLRQLFAFFPPYLLRVNSRSGHKGFVVHKMIMNVFSLRLQFPLSVLILPMLYRADIDSVIKYFNFHQLCYPAHFSACKIGNTTFY